MGSDAEGTTTFSIAGGVGSVSYTMAEIADAGNVVTALARRMESLMDALHSESVWLSNATAGTLLPRGPLHLGGPLNAMAHAEWATKRAQMNIATLAQQLTAAADNYAATESRMTNATAQAGRLSAVREGMNTWGMGLWAPLKLALDLGRWLNGAKDGELRSAAEGALNNGIAYGAGALGPSAGILYLLSQRRSQQGAASGVRPVVAARRILDSAGLSRPGTLLMRSVPPTEWNPVAAGLAHHAPADPPAVDPLADPLAADRAAGQPWAVQASIAGMMAGSQDAYAYPPGSIAVIRIERAEGAPAWIVHLPGTQDWSTVDSSNPFDMEGNIEGLTGAYKDSYRQQHILVQDLMKEALRASGALPTDDVLLTGHSGGGIHAAAAAADREFLAQVNVKMIVIAGAPAKNLDVAEHIAVVDLENENDIVTAADFGTPPATSNWVTVTSHRLPLAVPATVGGLATMVKEAHAVENYVKDAEELGASTNPAVVAQKQALATFLGVGIGALAHGKKFVFQGRDQDVAPRSKSERWKRPVSQPSAAGGAAAQVSGNH